MLLSPTRLANAALASTCALACAAPAFAQDTTWRAAFGPCSATSGAPAIEWMRHELLASSANWPKGLDPASPFCAWAEGATMRFGDAVALPEGCLTAGEFVVDGCTIAFECRNDGSETWRLGQSELPASLASLFAQMRIDVDGPPRTIDFASLAGNLAGVAVEEDARARILHLAAMQCGEVTLAASLDDGRIVVTGRGAGGLVGPAWILSEILRRDAAQTMDDNVRAWAARAFAGADGDRIEAARQLQRGGAAALPALRALLHGDEASRVCAIDGLVRLRAAAELPRIVAAADADMPLATAMAKTAIDELLPLADAATRERAREALTRNSALDAGLIASPARVTTQPRWRLLALSSLTLACLVGMWLRERARLAAAERAFA